MYVLKSDSLKYINLCTIDLPCQIMITAVWFFLSCLGADLVYYTNLGGTDHTAAESELHLLCVHCLAVDMTRRA